MNPQMCIESLERFPRILKSLVDGISAEEWTRKPASENWSILEIVCHLRDEEREDFRKRLECTLAEPIQSWPPIDPAGAAISRNYQQQSPQTALQEFCDERQASLRWLRSLHDVNWHRAYQHPKIGPMPAGDLLAAWAAHDLLHVRQITKRLFESLQQTAQPFKIDYAGSWAESH